MLKVASDSEHVFQSAAWMWLAYLLAMGMMDVFIYTHQPAGTILWYYLGNGLPALIFLILAYSAWLSKKASIKAALLISLITITPILINYVTNLHLPPAPLSNLEGMVLRQLPLLFIALVLVAWHYSLITIVLYSLATNLLEIGIVLGFVLVNGDRLTTLFFIVLVRTVCLIVVGIFVNKLITRLRAQQNSLKSANLQLAHYASTLEDLTISRERNRMSRELHDTVVHTLSGLSVQLETVQAYLDLEPETARQLIDQSLKATRSGLQETRRSLKALRASPLDDLGLVNAIRVVTETAAQRARLAIELNLPDADPVLSPDVAQCLYRVCQEAVENAVRHADARHLSVSLRQSGEDTELSIRDDGVGFSPEQSQPAEHYGLAGIKERAQMVGGQLSIASRPGEGTTIHLKIKGCLP